MTEVIITLEYPEQTEVAIKKLKEYFKQKKESCKIIKTKQIGLELYIALK